MKITYVNYYLDKDITVENYFKRYSSVEGWCKCLANSGSDVSVFQRFNKNITFRKEKVVYNFCKDEFDNNLKKWQIPFEFHQQILDQNPDIIHINSFKFLVQACFIKKKSGTAKIIIQHHAEKPHNGLRKYLQLYFSRLIDGFIFTSQEISKEWINAGALSSKKKIAEIVENSTDFVNEDKLKARIKTGLTGDPILLWVGRLNQNKDPITVVLGFKILVRLMPKAKLYMIYSENEMENRIREIIASDDLLISSVKLIGKVEHSLIMDYYNSSDYFVIGSLYESTCYSLVEAMACGVVPVVTDIPSFRTITKNGSAGILWKQGNQYSFLNSMLRILKMDYIEQSELTMNIFKEELSFEAISNKARLFYSNF
ncbi:MAG TPA: glycosyltransferase family 4 protein [Ignavibacteriaceae bacterium]|nr:glycosyltransferase family 4 protein [Ignavibacteriaceae bacterium]